jgi:hypothetical protein
MSTTTRDGMEYPRWHGVLPCGPTLFAPSLTGHSKDSDNEAERSTT